MSWGELSAKFADSASHSAQPVDGGTATDFLALAADLEGCTDVGALVDMVSLAPTPSAPDLARSTGRARPGVEDRAPGPSEVTT
jgi:hypothetical protein